MLIFLDKWIKYIPTEVSEHFFALGNYKRPKQMSTLRSSWCQWAS